MLYQSVLLGLSLELLHPMMIAAKVVKSHGVSSIAMPILVLVEPTLSSWDRRSGKSVYVPLHLAMEAAPMA